MAASTSRTAMSAITIVSNRCVATPSRTHPTNSTFNRQTQGGRGYDKNAVDGKILSVLSDYDAINDSINSRVFLGNFTPQVGAVTNGSGVLSFMLQGDNDAGLLSYSFSNLLEF